MTEVRGLVDVYTSIKEVAMAQLPIEDITKAVSSAVTSVLNKLSESRSSSAKPGSDSDDFELPQPKKRKEKERYVFKYWISMKKVWIYLT